VAMARRGTALYEAVAPRGVVVPPDNLKALTAAITALANDAERRAALGKAARAYAERTLSPESTIRTFEERLAMLLREVGGKRGKDSKGNAPSLGARPSGAAARHRRKPATAEEAAPD
ncbi:MAG: colanic acid biosynthesis glycosyltransferase WcaI, partial [Paraburkholderia nemoris]